MKPMRGFLLLILLGVLIFSLSQSWGPLPPLGDFLNPFTGFWQNGRRMDSLPETLELDGLAAPVEIVMDHRRVPHIFAGNDRDLYFAQGYITAKYRLWQMDFLARSTAGRLSEVLGPKTVDIDRYYRRLGLAWGAENALREVMANDTTRQIFQAYSDGVNAFIHALSKRDWPVEFKLLNYRPEAWSPLKSLIVLKAMAWDMTGYNTENALTRVLAHQGEAFTRALYPDRLPFLDPVIPKQTRWPFAAALPQKPMSRFIPESFKSDGPVAQASPVGSNNWAVAGSRTESGAPVLCNDPHLGLNLPAIWFENQLSSNGVGVYGVSIPGLPCVVIGFNGQVAWGLTNAGSDVQDLYVLALDSTGSRYRYNDEWRACTWRVEEIAVKGGAVVTDSVLHSHFGPVLLRDNEPEHWSGVALNASVRWTGHDPSNEVLAFYRLNRARNHADYLNAMSFFDCPAQNFAFASQEGDIALRHNGKFPLRWKGQGRTLSDGSDPAYAWHGWVPREHVPGVLNPREGFVASANQPPVDETYPYYLGWNWASFFRGTRIRRLLDARTDWTPQSLMAMQMDNGNVHAQTILPRMLSGVDSTVLNESQLDCFRLIAFWDFRQTSKARSPVLFHAWWSAFMDTVWRDETEFPGGWYRPRTDVTMDMMLHHPRSQWFDNSETSVRESLDDLLHASFQKAADECLNAYGPPGPDWEWGRARGTDIRHLARLEPFSRMGVNTSGGGGIINATSRTFGPSWRMVVELGQDVNAWGVYPGGQSGHPGSPWYDNMIDGWTRGDMHPLNLAASPDSVSSTHRLTLEVKP